jgi:hypothetical protein
MARPLDPLPYPVYFIRNDPELCASLAEVTEMPEFEQFYRPYSGGSSSWIVQTYLQLKLRGLAVHLVSGYVAGQICVVAREELMRPTLWQAELPFRSYLVVCQQDRPRPAICEHRIVQNQLNARVPQTDHYVPHWPQPNLKPRDRDRGTQIKTVGFKGRWYYLPESFKSPKFVSELNNLGIELDVLPDLTADLASWSDYSQTDVVLALRHNRELYLHSKPATKLINAWMAGCPALMGAEPAYQALRRSELDYIEVQTQTDVIQALQRLQNNPELYQAMVENGFQRVKEFSPDAIAQYWRNLLAGEISEGYAAWLNQQPLWRHLGRPLQFTGRLALQELERHRFNRQTGRTAFFRKVFEKLN